MGFCSDCSLDPRFCNCDCCLSSDTEASSEELLSSVDIEKFEERS